MAVATRVIIGQATGYPMQRASLLPRECVHVCVYGPQSTTSLSSWTPPSSPLITADKIQPGDGYFTRKAACQGAVHQRMALCDYFKQFWS